MEAIQFTCNSKTSLEALAKRDAKDDPFNPSSSASQSAETPKPDAEQPEGENALKSLYTGVLKMMWLIKRAVRH